MTTITSTRTGNILLTMTHLTFPKETSAFMTVASIMEWAKMEKARAITQ